MTKGERFTRLIALEPTVRAKSGNEQWLFQCDCGHIVTARTVDVKRGFKKSCGCFHRDAHIGNKYSVTHGRFHTPEYNTWAQMIQRCVNPKNAGWKDYAARGITVCERWLVFENFFADMGQRPSPKHSIDRINNDGNYEPGNCRWATRSQQNKNKRHPNRERNEFGRYTGKIRRA